MVINRDCLEYGRRGIRAILLVGGNLNFYDTDRIQLIFDN